VADRAVSWHTPYHEIRRKPPGYIEALKRLLKQRCAPTGQYVAEIRHANPRIGRKIKSLVLIRDEFKCRQCGQPSSPKTRLTIDHVVPLSRGGANTIRNLQTLCEWCNHRKGSGNW
jgi:5-methylcytosine-specific restriction protein A